MLSEMDIRGLLLRKKRELEMLESNYNKNTNKELENHYIYEIANCKGVIYGLEYALGK